MADFYLDTSAIGNEYQAYADTPATWGVPQDGNGGAGPGHSAAVAIATIDCASASASGAGSLSLLGQTVSSTLTGSGATLAANIVTAINAYSTAVIATYSALLLPLNKLVFARQNPGTTTQVQIMLRIAGANWNGMTPASGGTWGTAPTMGAFSGGADGPFAYLVNNSTVFGKTVATYGVLCAKSAGVVDPGAANDVINARTKRSGTDTSTTVSSASAITIACPTSTDRRFLFDNGTVWSGDNGVHTINLTNTAGNFWYWKAAAGKTLALCAKAEYGLKIVYTGASTGGPCVFGDSSGLSLELVNAEINETTNVSVFYVMSAGGQGWNYFAQGCLFKFKSVHGVIHSLNSNSYSFSYKAVDCQFDWTGIGANISGIVPIAGAFQYSGKADISFTNCRFTVDGGAYYLGSPLSGVSNIAASSLVSFSFLNCEGMLNPSAGFVATTTLGVPTFLWDDSGSGRSFRYETANYQLDWIANGTYPTYSAVDASGGAVSQRLSWETARLIAGRPISVGRYGCWYAGADGIKALSLELIVPTAEIPTNAQLGMSIKYIRDNGSVVFENTMVSYVEHLNGSASALPAGVGTSAWALNGLSSVSSVKLSITTAYPVKQNSEIVAELILNGPPTSNRSIYINPELLVS